MAEDNLLDDLSVEHRKDESGLRLRGNFIPFLKPGDKLDVIVAVPWGWHAVSGSIKGTCDTCGGDISLAPSTQELMKEYPGVPTRCIDCMKKQLEEEQKKKEG